MGLAREPLVEFVRCADGVSITAQPLLKTTFEQGAFGHGESQRH